MTEKFSLPPSLEKLGELATNLWFSWNPDVRDLYREIDLDTWRNCGRNPAKFLESVDTNLINDFSKDSKFIDKVNDTWTRFHQYSDHKKTDFCT